MPQVQLRSSVTAFLILFASQGTLMQSVLGQAESSSADDSGKLTVQQIFGKDENGKNEWSVQSFGPSAWLDGGDAYTTVETTDLSSEDQGDASPANGDSQQDGETESDGPSKKADQIVKYDTASGERKVLVSADQLTPPNSDKPLPLDNYTWSEDKSKLLIFTNSVKVWRDNTRGDYWVLDFEKGSLVQVGKDAPPSTLMFAKFSPEADRVGYVQANNIYVESLTSGDVTALTTDGDDRLINGTFDWVYEEELDLQDGFRFSPDGKRIAFWQLDSSAIRDFLIINNTDELYPTVTKLPYPKVGTENSSCRIGVVSTDGGETHWMKIPGDPRNHYLASLEWNVDNQHLLIEQLNRLQNQRTLYRVDARTGVAKSVFVDRDDAWVDLRHKFDWYRSDTHRLVLSEQDGWRHVYRVALQKTDVQQVTHGVFDVVDLVGADQSEDGSGWLYYTASPDDPLRRYLYRVPLDGSGDPERLTPENQRGVHSYNVSDNGKWAIHTYSRLSQPPVIDLISLPTHRSVRMLEDNAEVASKLQSVEKGPLKFFRVDINTSDGPLGLDGWMIQPPHFDQSKQYPIVFYVYTEPWGQTARDAWNGKRHLWHLLLAQRGYLIATVDNRGTPAPRGRAWRKAIYGRIGDVNVADQAAAAKKIMAWPFVDPERVAVWGWSGGGTMTLNAMFQHPEIYKLGISVAPVGDEKLYDTIYQERYMGLPDENADGYRQGSAVTHAHKLQGKLLLVHGTGDDNVHYQNSEVIINELIKHNRPFDMMAYPNRAHAIRSGTNTSVHLFELLTRYLTTNMPAESPASSEAGRE